MKIELVNLEISAIRDFDLKQRVDFPNNQVTSIVGINKDDGGSNGTGKSTLAMSVLINLYGPSSVGISAKNLKNRYLDVPARVIGTYLIDGKELIIDRTIGGKLSYKLDGKDGLDGKVDDIQKAINDILGIKEEQFLMLSNKAQGEYGGFLLMTDSQKKEFLSSFFEIGWIDVLLEQSKKKEVEYQNKLNSINILINEKTNWINSLKKDVDDISIKIDNMMFSPEEKAKVDSIKENIKSMSILKDQLGITLNNKDSLKLFIDNKENVKKNAEDLQKAILELENTQKELDELSVKSNIEIDALKNEADSIRKYLENNSIEAEVLKLDSEIKQINDSLKSLDRQKTELIQFNMQVKSIENDLSNLKSEFQSVETAMCSSCNQVLQDNVKDSMKKKIELKIANKLNEFKVLSKKIADIGDIESSINELNNKKTVIINQKSDLLANNNSKSQQSQLNAIDFAIKSKINNIENLNKSIKMKSNLIELLQNNHLVLIKNEENNLKNQYNSLLSSIQNNEIILSERTIRLNEYNFDKNRKQKELTEEEGKLTKLVFDKNAIELELKTLTHIKNISSNTGFKGYLFDSVLEDLNSKINQNLKVIPNTKKFSLQFHSDKVGKTTGNTTKSITYELYSGNSQIDFNTLSGGEKLGVIISVDEALDEVLSNRLGVHIGWKFLDEQFGWIDENSKEAILEFFKLKSNNKAYFIVDHTSEFNAAIDSRITIIKENNIARIA